ncbi:MAG: hypothetical protein GVY36_13115 [Verrucomicrobia bacterium]|jgi:hypothetical protein|nr:hypothetical protein [Verrucomicrobiota bacterium]
MKLPFGAFFATVLTIATSCLVASEVDAPQLSFVEATEIIEQRIKDQEFKETVRKAEVEAVPAIESSVFEKDGHRVTVNRITPPIPKVAPASIPDGPNTSSPLTRAKFEARMADQPEQQSISLSVTLFGDEYSKIFWRKPRSAEGQERHDAPEEFELWTNINLNYLRPISSFEQGGVVYNYFGFGETITREGEVRRSAFAKEHGYEYKSRWEESPADFTTGQSEYVVVDNGGRSIPPELYQQMDALFAHYLENQTTFKTEHLNSESLRKAKDAYLKKNPPQPKDVIINHWSTSKGGQR